MYRLKLQSHYKIGTNSMCLRIKNFALPCSGDHDMVIPHNGIEQWINYLDLTLDTDWRPWFVDGQVAG